MPPCGALHDYANGASPPTWPCGLFWPTDWELTVYLIQLEALTGLAKVCSPSEGNAPGTSFPFFSPFPSQDQMCGTDLHSYLTLEASSPLPNPTESSQAAVSLPIYEREINNCGSKPLRFGSCYAALSQLKTQNILRNILIRKLLCGFLPGRPKPHS